MPKLVVYRLQKLSEILKRIEKYQVTHENVWFRGVGDRTFTLLPSIARIKDKSPDLILEQIEPGIAATFSQRSLPFIDRDLSNA